MSNPGAERPVLVLLPGMDGTGLMFGPFLGVVDGLDAQVLRYPPERYPELYGDIYQAAHTRKSPEQRRKWRVERETRLADFVTAIGGNKPLTALTADDALTFRTHWKEKVLAGTMTIATANKYL